MKPDSVDMILITWSTCFKIRKSLEQVFGRHGVRWVKQQEAVRIYKLEVAYHVTYTLEVMWFSGEIMKWRCCVAGWQRWAGTGFHGVAVVCWLWVRRKLCILSVHSHSPVPLLHSHRRTWRSNQVLLDQQLAVDILEISDAVLAKYQSKL